MTPNAEDNSSPATPPFVHSDTVYDCPPTLDDQGVIDFCRNGFLIFPGVVPDEINARAIEYVDNIDSGSRPDLAHADWFVDAVLKNAQAAGAVRALLGRDFALPVRIHNHRGPLPASNQGGWHRDGGAIHTHRVENLQVFYYPEACTDDMGPTEVLPGSHFVRTKHNMMSHYGKIAGTVSTACVAGTIFLTAYSIWHRRTRATSGPTSKSKFRNLFKYTYWRTTAPERDWIVDPAFNFTDIDFSPDRDRALFEQGQGAIAAGKMFAWLSGVQEQYVKRGGPCWPLGPVGMPPGLENPTD